MMKRQLCAVIKKTEAEVLQDALNKVAYISEIMLF